MGQSYRIKTELGTNKTINIQLDQEFEFLEILSLKIQQSDVYTRSCADYGVLVGRVTANNGLGIPNARVAVFVPINNVDESNPLISSVYPYESPSDKNEDGYRYNLLPYEKSYSKHAATGTLPTRADSLTGITAVEIYDTYYRYTAKTNDSGDYMIMGVPLGEQSIVMDVDLSDIGEFSLTPQDLIRTGLATESQVAGSKFRTSTDLNSLPQIVNLVKNVEISPLWGDPTVCQIAVNRLDFDLRDDANIDIQPTSVFMGSIFSSPDSMRIRKNCKPRDNMGNLCNLTTSPGQIIALRQTIRQDSDGNPIIETYELEQAGNIIDGSGVWFTELPMNLDYFITNEFGEKVISNDPTIGIPTKSKYRFKIKWTQPNDLSAQTRRPYYLVPNVKEYGWTNSDADPTNYRNSNISSQQNLYKQQQSSYYFGLAWSGYTDGFAGQTKIDRLNEIINCEDTFYEFQYNRVYTISSLIDQFKKGRKGNFIGIKEIDNNDCESTVNKFPVNDGFRNFDFLFFLFSILMQVIQLIGLPLLVAYHFIAFLWNNFAVPVLVLLIGYFIKESVQNFIAAGLVWPSFGLIAPFIAKGLINLAASIALISNFSKIISYKFGRLKVPMITYPDCQACECDPEKTETDGNGGGIPSSALTQLSNSILYYQKILDSEPELKDDYFEINDDGNDREVAALAVSQAVGTRADEKSNNGIYKSTESKEYRLPVTNDPFFAFSNDIPLGERVNVFNTRKKYFDGINRISVSFDVNSNLGKNHYDNTLTTLMSDKFESGTLFTFVNPATTSDLNYLWTGETPNLGVITGISGTTKRAGQSNLTIEYATSQTTNQSLTYFLSKGSTNDNYKFPLDLEYYQVITAITVSEAAKIWAVSGPNDNYFPGVLNSTSMFEWHYRRGIGGWFTNDGKSDNFITNTYFEEFQNQYITILQRGVDPYSPTYTNQFGLGKIFGYNDENAVILTANTRLNVPIQKLLDTTISVQKFNSQNNVFYPSYFFLPGDEYSGFSSSNVGYYGALDASYLISNSLVTRPSIDGARGVVSQTSNNAYSLTPTPSKYDSAEDLSGCGYYYMEGNKKPSNYSSVYYSPSLYPTLKSNPMNMSSKTLNVMRTDRLPSSDFLDGSAWENNAALLQQNLGFTVYLINTDDEDFTTSAYGTGADIVTADIEGQIYENEVLTSLNTCTNLVGLNCYEGFGGTFQINKDCPSSDPVENGCYTLVNRPLIDLGKDFKTWSEWGYRFRFFYGLCRGVLSQSFMNNWINGSFYMFPIQVDTSFDKQNKPERPIFCSDVVYFDSSSNNFYYRSSPWNDLSNTFIGKLASDNTVNKLNLLYPTTIINLGIKDNFYSEIIFEPSTKGYIIPNLNPTSYADTSDLINLFVISRITDETFLKRILVFGDSSLNQLFSRDERRIDGDLAQLLSINSEIGNINFSPEYYSVIAGQTNNPVNVLGSPGNPTIAVWFSSTTQDLQTKDYLTPGTIDFRGNDNIGYYPYPYGIKSQLVPFYQWKLGNGDTIFGNQNNTWATSSADIVQNTRYQSLDRYKSNTPYFWSSDSESNDLNARGYIFNANGVIGGGGQYLSNGGLRDKFLVGAPFQFYFGVIKGETALDKFKSKYSIDE